MKLHEMGRRAMVVALLGLGTALACAAATAHAETRQLVFREGLPSVSVQGVIRGSQSVDYKLQAKAGQTLSVDLKSNHGANYFNLLAPGSNGPAFFVGSSAGPRWSGLLPADGEYTVRVYLMRSAARRQESAAYTLTARLAGASQTSAASTTPALGIAPAGDAQVPGTRFHATGTLPCRLGAAPAGSTACEFGVIRGAPGHADVHITPQGGSARVLHFRGGRVTSSGKPVKATQQGDVWTIETDNGEHYEVPTAVISGG